jgi:CDGSH-type Zn-finger protein
MPERDAPVQIVAYPNGPLLVRGEVEIRTPEGEPLPQRRRTVALCRCGKSTIKPYCDGTHKLIGFVTEPEGPDDRTP